jgi:hypothetical protein
MKKKPQRDSGRCQLSTEDLMELEALKTILPSIGSLFGVVLTGAIGIATYSWQENSKRKTELVERRQKLYEDLNGALFGLIIAKTIEDRRRILADIEKGWLFASDEVLAALFKYMECYDRYWVSSNGNVQQLIQQDVGARQDIEHALSEIFWPCVAISGLRRFPKI